MTATTDTRGDELLATIARLPAEDTPRLVYADWLDEQDEEMVTCPKCKGNGRIEMLEHCPTCHGTGTVRSTANADRAEFIRVQVEADRIRGGGCAVVLHQECDGTKEWCIRCGLIRRSHELLRLHADTWRPEVLREKHGGPQDATILYASHVVTINEWRRGFPYAVTLTAAQFLVDHERRIDAGVCPVCSRWDDDTFARNTAAGIHTGCTGRLTLGDGFAARLFRSVPVEGVRMSDKEPGHHEGGTGDRAGYWWEPGIRYDAPRQIPFEIGEAGVKAKAWRAGFHGGLMVYVPCDSKPRDKGWDTPELAHNALSDACVLYGREMAFGASEKGKRV